MFELERLASKIKKQVIKITYNKGRIIESVVIIHISLVRKFHFEMKYLVILGILAFFKVIISTEDRDQRIIGGIPADPEHWVKK